MYCMGGGQAGEGPLGWGRTAYSSMIHETALARVAVPCRIISGRLAASAAARSVWIGFQILAHSL